VSRRLTGAVLYQAVIRNLALELAEDYGVPMAEYKGEVADIYDIGSDMQPILCVTFTRFRNGHTIQVTNIHPGDDGSVIQRAAGIEFR
jgi:hypothetical protein